MRRGTSPMRSWVLIGYGTTQKKFQEEEQQRQEQVEGGEQQQQELETGMVQEQQEGAVGGVVQVEEELVGGADGGSFSTPRMGGGAKPRSGKRRRRTKSDSSPEEAVRDLVEELRVEADSAVEEIRSYILRNFASKHENYLSSRFVKLQEAYRRLECEYLKAARIAQKVHEVERSVKSLVETDSGSHIVEAVAREAREAGERVHRQISAEIQGAMDKMKFEVAGAFDTITVFESERVEAVKDIKKAFKDESNRMSGEMRLIREGMETSKRFMRDVTDNMTRVYERVSEVHNMVGPLEQSIVREVKGVESKMTSTPGSSVSAIGDKLQEVVEKVVQGVREKVAMRPREEAASVPMEVEEETWATVASRGRIKRGPRVKLEIPRGADGARVSKEEVVECLGVKKGDVRVRGLVKRGRDFVIEVHDNSDVEKLRINDKLREKGVVVDGIQGWRWLRVKLCGVQGSIERTEERKKECVPEFVVGRGREVLDWVVRVSGRVFRRMMDFGRLYIGTRTCRVVEYLEVKRCNRCMGLGHLGRSCAAPVVCGWCGSEGHHEVSCNRRSKEEGPRCANCVRYGFRQTDHLAA